MLHCCVLTFHPVLPGESSMSTLPLPVDPQADALELIVQELGELDVIVTIKFCWFSVRPSQLWAPMLFGGVIVKSHTAPGADPLGWK